MCVPRPPAPTASRSCRSWSTPTSSTPTGFAPSRPAPFDGRCRAATTGSSSTGCWSPAWNVNPWSIWSPASPAASSVIRLADLAALPRAAVVVEDRYSQLFKLDRVRPALVADGLAELQIRWPNVPIVFCETRQLAEEWTYRYLAAAHTWANTELALTERLGTDLSRPEIASAEPAPEPSTAEVRTWARTTGLDVPGRARLHPDIWQTCAPRTVSDRSSRQRSRLTHQLQPPIPSRSPIARYRPTSIDVRDQGSHRGAQIDHYVCRGPP